MGKKTITFRAGIATYDEETKMCHPEPMQGTITISPSGGEEDDEEMVEDTGAEASDADDDDEMGFWDFQWSTKDRSVSGHHASEPIQLILIPGETAWVHVKSCPDARVFALVFSSNEKYFFWLQEKNPTGLALNELSDKDKTIYDKIVALLNPGEEDEVEEGSSDSKGDKTPEQDEDNEQNNDIIMADAAA